MAYTFKDIKVWQKVHEMVLEIYKITRSFPNSEKYGLTSQLITITKGVIHQCALMAVKIMR